MTRDEHRAALVAHIGGEHRVIEACARAAYAAYYADCLVDGPSGRAVTSPSEIEGVQLAEWARVAAAVLLAAKGGR